MASNLVDPSEYQTLPHIAPNHIESNTGRLLPYTTVAADGVISSKHLFRPGQVIYSKIRPYLAKAVVADFGGLCSADMYPIESDVLDARFLKWWMLTPEFTRLASGEQGRTVLPKINKYSLGLLPVPVPPCEEQRRIVDVLEDHLSRLDAGVRSLDENRKRLAALRQAAIDRAFWTVSDPSAERFLSELISQREWPAGNKTVASPDMELFPDRFPWPVASLEQLTDPLRTIRYGILKPKVHGGTVPYVEVKDLRDGALDATSLRLTSADLDAQYAAARLRPGDVVVAVRGSFERSAIVPTTLRTANISRDVVRLAPLPGLSSWYLHYWHQTSTTKRYLRRHARGVAVRGVNVGSLRAMPVPVVTPDAQLAVVRAISEQEEAITRLDQEVQVAEARASQLRGSLLTAAFSGRLVGDSLE